MGWKKEPAPQFRHAPVRVGSVSPQFHPQVQAHSSRHARAGGSGCAKSSPDSERRKVVSVAAQHERRCPGSRPRPPTGPLDTRLFVSLSFVCGVESQPRTGQTCIVETKGSRCHAVCYRSGSVDLPNCGPKYPKCGVRPLRAAARAAGKRNMHYISSPCRTDIMSNLSGV